MLRMVVDYRGLQRDQMGGLKCQSVREKPSESRPRAIGWEKLLYITQTNHWTGTNVTYAYIDT